MTALGKGVQRIYIGHFTAPAKRFAQSTAGQTPNGDPHGQVRPRRRKSSSYRALERRMWHSALGKVTDMKTTFVIESRDSPAPGIIAELARVHEPPAAPAGRAARRAAGRANNPRAAEPQAG